MSSDEDPYDFLLPCKECFGGQLYADYIEYLELDDSYSPNTRYRGKGELRKAWWAILDAYADRPMCSRCHAVIWVHPYVD